MKKNEKPEVLLMDFDRTLTSLYDDRQRLLVLADRVTELYRGALPCVQEPAGCDGYFVWHELHRRAEQELPDGEAESVNRAAEQLVTDFEMEIMRQTELFSGVPEVLEELSKRGIVLGVVSSNSSSVLEYAFEKAGVRAWISCITGRPVPFHPAEIKPAPEPVYRAVQLLQAAGKTIWYAGDDVIDIQAARAAHVCAVGVASGNYTCEELLAAGADLCVEKFVDILNIFKI